MQNKKGCSRWIWIFAGLGLLASIGCLVGYVLIAGRLNRLRSTQTLNAPPTVMIDSPAEDLAVTPGYLLGVGIIASGANHIKRIELWMDGVKVDEAINTETADSSTFSADFSLTIPEGQHILVARAIDSASLVGQSPIRGVFADPQLAAQENANPTNPENPNPNNQGNTNPTNQGNLPPDTENIPATPFDVPNTPMLEQTPLTGTYTLIDLIAGDTSASQPPKAPSGLQVQIQDCKMILTWQDNADNELAYGVWVKEIIGPGRRIASLKPPQGTGQAWFQFDVLPIGVYGIWVEAVNWLGAQPSNVVWVRVDELGCATHTATELEFDVKKFDVSGTYQGIYCFVSAEGSPRTRIPPEPDYFWLGPGSPVPGTVNKYIFKIPDDRVLDLEGDCYGFNPGNSPDPKIGSFKTQLPESSWDGQEHSITIGSKLEFTLQPLGLNIAQGPYGYIDSSLPSPKISSVRTDPLPPIFGSSGSTSNSYQQGRIITWDWDVKSGRGSSGFTIYLNGVAVKSVGPEAREERLWLPKSCGGLATYEVAADFGNSQSTKDRWVESLPDCPVEVKIEFLQLHLDISDDGSGSGSSACVCCPVPFGIELKVRFSGRLVERDNFRDSPNWPINSPIVKCGNLDFDSLFPYYGLSFTPPAEFVGQVGEPLPVVEISALVFTPKPKLVADLHRKFLVELDLPDEIDQTLQLPFQGGGNGNRGWISVRLTGTKAKP